MNHFYVSDLDGTLLNKFGTLSANSRAGLRKLLADGMTFSVDSARSVVSIQPILSGLPLSLPVIEYNGAFLSDLETGRHEIVNSIDSAVAGEIFALLQRFARMPVISTFNGAADCLYYGQSTNDGESFYVTNRLKYKDPRLRLTDDLGSALSEQVVCMTVIARVEALTDIERAIGEQFGEHIEMHLFENQYSPGWYWLTVHDHKATKDQGIRLLADTYGLRDHSLVVFGDEMNDIGMFRLASERIAPANARTEVKDLATQVIGHHDEDSVVEFIRRHHRQSRAHDSCAQPHSGLQSG